MKHACEEISLLVSENLERKLSFREKLTVRIHLMVCAACRHYSENMSKLHVFFQLRRQQSNADVNLPSEKRKEIEHVLEDLPPKT